MSGCKRVIEMKATVKFVFASILIVLLMSAPVGACMVTSAPSHPCCPPKPAPIPEDCARPGCIYMDTHQVLEVAASATDGVAVSLLPAATMELRPVTVLADMPTLTPSKQKARVVLFHQFLI